MAETRSAGLSVGLARLGESNIHLLFCHARFRVGIRACASNPAVKPCEVRHACQRITPTGAHAKHGVVVQRVLERLHDESKFHNSTAGKGGSTASEVRQAMANEPWTYIMPCHVH